MKRSDMSELETKKNPKAEQAQGRSEIEKLLRTGIKAGVSFSVARCW